MYGGDKALLGIITDITERKRAEQELRSERDFVHSLLDTANSLIVCLDGRARITVFNKECEKVTGYTREEVIGKSWPEIFLPEDHHHHRLKDFAEWVRQHPHDMYEGPLKTKSGQIRTILWSNSALFSSDSDELTAIAIGQDITERKEAERQLQVASQKRYNQVKEIAGGVSHEIFNALFPATSCLSKLSQRLDLSRAEEIARNRKLIQVVENAVQRAVEMTELVTEYSKLESDRKVEEVSLQAILQEILLANESRIEELKVKVKLEVSGDFLLKCHRPHIYSLFNNLMVNALDALAEVKQRNISISACKKGGRLSVEFSDSGVGIPPENIDKIFDAFFSTKPRTGTGLGLAISKKIVELYDGSIEVNSSLDKGTKFIILL
jgi:PAS domain S-box-containing protein